jgi:acyl carrier protein
MDISEAVLRFVAEESGCEVTEDTPFAELPLDSLDMLHLLTEIESETGVLIAAAHLGEFETVGDLARAAEGWR